MILYVYRYQRHSSFSLLISCRCEDERFEVGWVFYCCIQKILFINCLGFFSAGRCLRDKQECNKSVRSCSETVVTVSMLYVLLEYFLPNLKAQNLLQNNHNLQMPVSSSFSTVVTVYQIQRSWRFRVFYPKVSPKNQPYIAFTMVWQYWVRHSQVQICLQIYPIPFQQVEIKLNFILTN